MKILPPSISPEDFATVCFITLMQNGEGLLDKAPSYIWEKQHILTDGYDAFGYLDYHNMGRVIRWMNTWGVNIPLAVEKEWKLQCDAMQDFYERGVKK